jgi:hypothetical protein
MEAQRVSRAKGFQTRTTPKGSSTTVLLATGCSLCLRAVSTCRKDLLTTRSASSPTQWTTAAWAAPWTTWLPSQGPPDSFLTWRATGREVPSATLKIPLATMEVPLATLEVPLTTLEVHSTTPGCRRTKESTITQARAFQVLLGRSKKLT